MFAHILHRESQILVASVDIGFRKAARAQARFHAAKGIGFRSDQQIRGHAIGTVVRHDEIAQIDSGFAVGREAHHFPFVAVGSEAKKMSELRVEKTERIRPGNCPEMFEAPVAAAPKRSGFPSAAAIENQHGRIVKSGIGKGADGVRQVVIHETKLRFRWVRRGAGNDFRRRAGGTC